MSVNVSREGSIAIVTLNRPERRNAFTMAMRQDIALAFEQLAEDDSVRGIILTGAGGHFCSGADTGEMGEPGSAAFLARMRRLHRMIRAIASVAKPVIAAVDGACVGAGWSLALACDLVIATPGARFAQIFGKIGYAPDAGAIWQLARLIPVMRAKEIVYSTRTLDGTEALSLGLVLDLVESDALMPHALDLARSLAAGPTLAIGMAKRQFAGALAQSLDQFLDQEFTIQPLLATSDDHREGIAAAREKRAPIFQGR